MGAADPPQRAAPRGCHARPLGPAGAPTASGRCCSGTTRTAAPAGGARDRIVGGPRGAPLPTAVVLFYREYETLFLPCAGAMAGKSLQAQRRGAPRAATGGRLGRASGGEAGRQGGRLGPARPPVQGHHRPARADPVARLQGAPPVGPPVLRDARARPTLAGGRRGARRTRRRAPRPTPEPSPGSRPWAPSLATSGQAFRRGEDRVRWGPTNTGGANVNPFASMPIPPGRGARIRAARAAAG